MESIDIKDDIVTLQMLDLALLKRAMRFFSDNQQLTVIYPFDGRKTNDYYAKLGFEGMGSTDFLYFDTSYISRHPDYPSIP